MTTIDRAEKTLRQLRLVAANDLRGFDWREDRDLCALQFIEAGQQWTTLIAYVRQDCRIVLYEAIPDIHKGIDIEDEKLIDVYETPQQAINGIKRRQVERGGARFYETAPAVNSMPQRAPHYRSEQQ